MLPIPQKFCPLEPYDHSKGTSGDRLMVLQFNSPSLRLLRPSYSPPPPPYPLEWDLHLPSFEVDAGLGARAQASTVGLTFGLGWGPFSSVAYFACPLRIEKRGGTRKESESYESDERTCLLRGLISLGKHYVNIWLGKTAGQDISGHVGELKIMRCANPQFHLQIQNAHHR